MFIPGVAIASIPGFAIGSILAIPLTIGLLTVFMSALIIKGEELETNIKEIEKRLKDEKRSEIPNPCLSSLFLRSFEDDRIRIGNLERVLTSAGSAFYTTLVPTTMSIQSAIASAGVKFNINYVMAAANPEQELQPLGAELVYLPQNNWKLYIEKYIKQTKLIFIIPGGSNGLITELEKIIKLNCLDKVVFIFPLSATQLNKTINSQQRWQELNEKLGSGKEVEIFIFSILMESRLHQLASLLLQDYQKLQGIKSANSQIREEIPDELCLGVFEANILRIKKYMGKNSLPEYDRLMYLLEDVIPKKIKR